MFAPLNACRAAGLVVLALLCLPGPASAGRPGTNVVIVTIDALRADRLSAYGYSRPTSPNLDRLIAAGARFDQARTVEPLTSPGLCSMLTSLEPHEHGSSRNGLRVRAGVDSLPKLVKSAGYTTAALVGAWPLRARLSGLDAHFDEYHEVLTRKRWMGLVSSEATATDLTDRALKWLDGRQREPFLLWIHYVEPHAPYKLHKELLPSLGLAGSNNLAASDRYDTEIAYADLEIGRLIEGLRQRGLFERTLWILTSDHGESLGEHDYWGHGRHLYDPTLKIPMALVWPGGVPPQIIQAPALNTDIAPTVVGLLGLAKPAAFDGFDWTPVLRGAPAPSGRVTRYQAHRGAVLSRHGSELARRSGLLAVAVIRDGVKEIYRVNEGTLREFDLRTDPRETRDRTGDHARPTAEVEAWMRAVYSGLNHCDDRPPEPLDSESVEELRSLGYAD